MTPPENDTLKKAADTRKSVHLSASAGSGKTRALKERCLALLDALEQRGLNMDQLVAITFTDKAAAEIRERVLRDLPEPALKKIIRGMQDLRISTIHSFCMNLLKRYPLEAGLPPDFGVLDSRDQAAKIRKAVEDALEEADRSRLPDDPLRHFSADELITAVEFIFSVRSRLKRMEIDAGGTEGLLQALRTGMAADRTESELHAMLTDPGWRRTLTDMERLLRSCSDYYDVCLAGEHVRLAGAGTAGEAALIIDQLVPVYFNKDGSPAKKCFIPKTGYPGKDRNEYEQTFFTVQSMLEHFRTAHAQLRSAWEAGSLLMLFLASEKKYQESKLREGVLDFDDLEIYAYRLLQGLESPDILYWLDRKILHFLVDEFQDTSDIQWAVLNKLTEEIFAGQGSDKRMQPTIFLVGDEKQSIYRFREANYRLIEIVRQKMENYISPAAREILTLNKNFRSTPQVIAFVNGVFAGLWGEAYERADAERREHAGSVRLIEAISGEIPEAQLLAREIASMTEQGALVYERRRDDASGREGGWTERPMGYGDCAVLIQSRARLKEYESALRALGIPYRVIGGIGFYEEDEIEALMNLLFFLENHDDRLALAHVLKSRLFGLNDRDIYDLQKHPGGMQAGIEQLRPREAKLLREWSGLAGMVPLAQLLHRILLDTAAPVRFGTGNPQAIFNIDKLLDTAREFDRKGYTTLQDFVEWVRNIRRTEQREAGADMTLPGFEGFVSIMTVHKAKGLEYPVVFLPGMNQQPGSLLSRPAALLKDSQEGVRIALKDPPNAAYGELWDREREELIREHQRLLYVAMTRARDHLVMIGSLNEGKNRIKPVSWLSYLEQSGAKALLHPDQGRQEDAMVSVSDQYRTAPVSKPGSGTISPVLPDIETLARNISPLLRSEPVEWKKATDFLQHDREEGLPEPLPPGAALVSPLVRGSVLHRCLEDFTKSGRYDAEKISAAYPDIMALPSPLRSRFLDDVNAVMTAVLEKPEHHWIFDRREQSFSELPILLQRGETVVSGVVDRLVIKGDTAFVIDYKAIAIENEESLASWSDYYRPQLRIYCEAAQEIFRTPLVEGLLFFLDSNLLFRCISI